MEARILSRAAEYSTFRKELKVIAKAAKRGDRHVDLPPGGHKLRLTHFLRELGYTVDPFYSSEQVRVSW